MPPDILGHDHRRCVERACPILNLLINPQTVHGVVEYAQLTDDETNSFPRDEREEYV